MVKIDSALGIEFEGERLALAVVARGIRDSTLVAQLVIEDYAAVPEAELLGRVQGFLRDHSFNRDNVIVGVPRDEVVAREIELPLEVEENLDQVVRFQVDRLEPNRDESSCFDYAVVGRNPAQEKLRLQIVMVRGSRLDHYLELVHQLGLEPRTITFGSAGLAALLSAHRDGSPARSAVMMLRGGQRGWDFLIAGPERRLLSDHLSLPVDGASAEGLLTGMHGALRRRGLEQESFGKLYLAGAPDPLIAALREHIPDVELLVGGLKLKAARGALDRHALAAAGLAVDGLQRRPASRVNLIPPDQRVVAERAGLWPSLVLAGLLLLTLAGVATRHFFQQSRLLAEVDVELTRLSSSMEEVFTLRDQVAAEQQELTELRELLRGRQVALGVLRDLTERLPNDTYLQTLQLQDTSLTIQGFSDSASQLPTLLLDSPILEAVKTDWITQDPRAQGKDRFKFSATVKK